MASGKPGAVQSKNIRDRILEIERKGLASLDSERDEEELLRAWEEMSTAYRELARLLPKSAKTILKNSLKKGRPLTIVGPPPAPFRLDAAPVHKLMISNALNEQRLSYRQGRTKRAEDRQVLVDQTAVPSDVYVVRHGAPATLFELFPELDEAETRALQSLHRDYVGEIPWEGDYYSKVTPSGCGDDPQSLQFIRAREKLVNRYLDKYYSHIPPEIRQTETGYRYGLYVSKVNPSRIVEIGGYDESIFGTPVEIIDKCETVKPSIGGHQRTEQIGQFLRSGHAES